MSAILVADSIGFLVPRGAFACTVHSVFRRACNFALDRTLLTLVAPPAGDGPATMVLGGDFAADLRRVFRPGERVYVGDGELRCSRTAVRFGNAHVWRPRPRRRPLTAARIEANLRVGAAGLDARQPATGSIVDGVSAAQVGALGEKARALDLPGAHRVLHGLIGLGHGLTPAGDDIVVGFLAGFDRVADSATQRLFCDGLRREAARLSHRTTAIGAHYLRLAAAGHFSAALERLRDALLCEDDGTEVERALLQTLAIGATSGADAVSGLLAGISAGLPGETTFRPT